MEGTKTCICCGEQKHVTAFHAHKYMRDGRLNKCSACVVASVSAWRDRNPDARAREYANGEGAAIRARGLRRRLNGEGYDPAKRRTSALKYQQKRAAQKRGMPVWLSELDELAFEEAKALADARTAVTGFEWSIDHIVPMNHRQATGLHNGFNLNVAPAVWNSSKANRHMSRYFGK